LFNFLIVSVLLLIVCSGKFEAEKNIGFLFPFDNLKYFYI